MVTVGAVPHSVGIFTGILKLCYFVENAPSISELAVIDMLRIHNSSIINQMVFYFRMSGKRQCFLTSRGDWRSGSKEERMRMMMMS